MTHDASDKTRRRFIKLTACGIATAPLAKAFVASPVRAAEVVAESNPQAQALGYKTDATKAANRKDAKAFCDTCNFYSGKPGASDGPCQIFAGNLVNPKGWCSAWVKKQA